MLTSNLDRVAVIVACIAVCVYEKEAIYTFLVKLFQTCLVCTLLYNIHKCIRYFQRNNGQREGLILLERQTTNSIENENESSYQTSLTDETLTSAMLTSNRVAVIIACIAVCVYTREAIYTFLIKRFQTCLVCIILFLVYKCIRHFQQKEEGEEIKLLKKQKTFSTTNDSDLILEDDQKCQSEVLSFSDEIKSFETSNDTYEIERKWETTEQLESKDQGNNYEISSGYDEIIRQDETKGQLGNYDNQTEKEVKNTIQEDKNGCEMDITGNYENDTKYVTMAHNEAEAKRGDVTMQKELNLKGEKVTIQEEHKTNGKQETIQEKPKTKGKQETIQEPKTKRKDDTIQEELKSKIKEETIQDELKTKGKQETIQELNTKIKEESIQENPKTKGKQETIQEEPKTKRKDDTIQEEPKTKIKEETIQDELKTKGKQETIQEKPKTKGKQETIQELKTKRKEETIQEEFKTKEKEKDIVRKGHYRYEGDPCDNNDAMKFQSDEQLEGKVNTKKTEAKDTIQEDNQGEDTKTVINDKEQCNDNAKVLIDNDCKLRYFLERLHLRQYCPYKLKLMDVMALRDCTSSFEINTIALHVAMKIIMINYTARDELLLQLTRVLKKENENTDHSSSLDNVLGCDDDDDDDDDSDDDDDDKSTSINPLDLLLTIFKCSSPMLQQILAVKLFKCKLAIPFVHPTFDKEPDLLTLWPLRSIMIECKTERGSLENISVDSPCHVVSFLRLGRPSVSKSKLMNDILYDQYHNTFFNRDCPLGNTHRLVSEGMVEAGWYLPSKKTPHFDIVTMFLNLRGDGKYFVSNCLNLSLISNVLVVLMHIDLLSDDQPNDLVRSLICTKSKICLAIDAGSYKRSEIKKKLELFLHQIKDLRDRPTSVIVTKNGQMRNISMVKSELRKTISDLANDSDLNDLTLSERVKKYKGKIDEQNEIYVKSKHAVDEIMCQIKSSETNVKTEVVPLQGKTWQTWSEKMKWSNKASLYKTLQEQGKLQNDMLGERQKQAKMCRELSPAMFLFLKYLQKFVVCEDECLVFILLLKQMLDESSRNILPGYLSNFQTCWQDLKLARDKNEHPDIIKSLRDKLDKSEHCLAEASFGFEHLCREMGQIYESLKEIPPSSKYLQQLKKRLPHLTAQLLLMGLPFEIMDGDVANIPLDWVTAVLTNLKEAIGDKRLLTLSVLGIQSSGKSTLLNTMFGLQFAVSAGRCTRGVYMQLVPVRRANSPFDLMLVIDTEGLRAPELAHQKHCHDNELATFVIGLGDITIVNIKGENTAEMKDVLQIAVHASLRLKLVNERLNLRQSCVFIHQNVPAFDANDKMIQGRQKFVEELDMMTKEAAEQENIADVQSFNQVIEFDSETNVWYFSDLWTGDPPMAPANPGYSDSVSDVKDKIISTISRTRSTYLTITDTISRISDLWNGIVKDDFVFSFRNSLELKAHASLEQICQEVSWKLEQHVLEFGLTKAKSRLVVCKDQNELENAVKILHIDLQKAVNSEVEKQIKELDVFIEQNTLKDVMIQWVQNKRIRLSNSADILIMNAQTNINNVKNEILVKYKTTEEKTRHEMEINELAKSLAIRMKGQKPKEEELRDQFNDLWRSWIQKFPTTQVTDVSIDLQIESTICEKFKSDAAFIVKQKSLSNQISYLDLKKLEGSLNETYITNEHISIHKKWKLWSKDKTDNCFRQTVDVVNIIFRKIDNTISRLSTDDIQFDIAYVTKILNLVVTGIEEHNRHENDDYKFNLLPPFRAMIINHVASYATIFFTRKNDEYNKKHSPKAQMEEYKGTAWILFKSTVQNKTDDVIAVGFFREAMMKELADHVDNLIPIDVSDHIFKHFGNWKHGLILEILKELANKENFDNYFKFIKDPNSYAEKWLTKLSQKKLFETTMNKQTTYAFLVEARALNLFEGIQKCIESSSKGFMGTISEWIDKFVSEVNSTDNLPLSIEMFVHVKNTPVTDIQAFVDLLNEEMVGAREEFLMSYKKTTWSSVKWKENPLPRIMKTLWGCTAFCMFCHEPCKEMNPDHWDRDKQPHRCVQHRPHGLNGFRSLLSQIMTVEFCNFSVSSEKRYIMKELSGPYKEYKNHFPSWDILPNANASDYWKWVTCKFKKEFLDKYEMNEPDIPTNWFSITKQKAIESLSTLS